MATDTIRTVCRSCHGGCGVLVTVEDGRIVGLEGDRENPNNLGFLCGKGWAAPELVTHPNRLERPLKRVGARGEGRFVPIGWDEAYDLVARRLDHHRTAFGPESIVLCQGTDRNYQEWVFRLANALGTPNVLGPAHVCFYPKIMAAFMTLGDMVFCDYESTPACVVVWGSNKLTCHSDGVIGIRLREALRRGSELVVIDPRRTSLARRARYWLQPRPGADGALALAFLRVVIEEGLVDREFIEAHTVGFDALRQRVSTFTPERAEALTSVPGPLIEEAARFYARAESAAIEVGTGVEQNRHSFQTARAILCLSAVCGNIDRPGGDVIWDAHGVVGRRDFPLREALPEAQQRKRLGGDRHRILGMSGWAAADDVWRAVLTGEPYPVKSLLVFGSNLLVAYADSERVRRALEAVEFLAVADLFLTPTARMADVVLPAASWLERDQIVEFNSFLAARRRCASRGECRSDEEMILELARRLHLEEHFWPTLEVAHDHKLRPIGHTWRSFAKAGYIPGRIQHRKYQTRGFRTRSGKLNLHCKGLEAMGYDPLPAYTPDESAPDRDWPYVLSSHHSAHYFNSEFRSLAALRRREPDPLLEIHPETASREGIREGEWVTLASPHGAAAFRARVTDDVAPGVVFASASWWFPEAEGESCWRRSNVNLLTREEGAGAEMGSSNLRGIPCRLRKGV
jgi:anaerobic selenocysteine-containing dehydrogenase